MAAPTTSFIMAKGQFLLENWEGPVTIGNVTGFAYGRVVLAGSGVIYEPGLVLLYRTSPRTQITIDNAVYYVMYDDDPRNVILFYEPDLA